MPHRRHWLRTHHVLCFVILALFALAGSAVFFGAHSPAALAQIDNNQPSQPFASVVSCIRTGADQGQPAEFAPRFANTCFGTKISSGGYASDTDSYDADPADAAIVDFGDAKPDGSGDLYGAASHTPDANLIQVGTAYGLA